MSAHHCSLKAASVRIADLLTENSQKGFVVGYESKLSTIKILVKFLHSKIVDRASFSI